VLAEGRPGALPLDPIKDEAFEIIMRYKPNAVAGASKIEPLRGKKNA
jgi:hypothetical protein